MKGIRETLRNQGPPRRNLRAVPPAARPVVDPQLDPPREPKERLLQEKQPSGAGLVVAYAALICVGIWLLSLIAKWRSAP